MADNNEKDITISDLYPDLSPEEQTEAERRLLGYFEIIQGIVDRYESEGRIDELIAKIRRHKRLRK